MATINQVVLTLSGMSSPVANDAVATLTAQAVTELDGVAADVTRVEFELLYSPLITAAGQGALKEVVSKTQDTTPSSMGNGTYSVTFASSLFANPGLYAVRAKAVVGSGSPEVISEFVVAESDEIQVTEASPQTLDDVKTVLAAVEADVADHETRLDALETPPPSP